VGQTVAPKSAYRLPVELRSRLAKPFGPIVQTDQLVAAIGGQPFAVVGDVVAKTCKELGLKPAWFVCDYKTERGANDSALMAALSGWGDREVRVANPAGHITREAWLALFAAAALPLTTRVVVDGEEDLLGLPAFLAMPIGSLVLYGMPGKGVVVVAVTEAVQQEAAAIVAAMDDL